MDETGEPVLFTLDDLASSVYPDMPVELLNLDSFTNFTKGTRKSQKLPNNKKQILSNTPSGFFIFSIPISCLFFAMHRVLLFFSAFRTFRHCAGSIRYHTSSSTTCTSGTTISGWSILSLSCSYLSTKCQRIACSWHSNYFQTFSPFGHSAPYRKYARVWFFIVLSFTRAILPSDPAFIQAIHNC